MNQVKSNGASSTLFQHDRPNKPNRSKFDLSRLANFSLDAGMIVPFDCFPVLPDDVVYLGNRFAIDTLPLVQSSLTSYKVLVHWYYMKSRDLWKGWKTFITKGRTGNVELEIPKVDLSVPVVASDTRVFEIYIDPSDPSEGTEEYTWYGKTYAKSKHSLSSFLGVPSDVDGEYMQNLDQSFNLYKDFLPFTFVPDSSGNYKNLVKTGFNPYDKVNALPFMMYQSIVKHNYVNQNLLQGNTALFPEEGDDDWLLPYSIENNIANFVDGAAQLSAGDKVNYNGIFSSDETKVDLRLLRYAMFDDDYFTSGLPWLQRGDVSTMDFDISDVELSAEGYDQIKMTLADGYFQNPRNAFSDEGLVGYDDGVNPFSPTPDRDNRPYTGLYADLASIASKINIEGLSGSLTANMLRNLLAISVWQERNARVDGSYNRMIFQHWNNNPNSEEHLPQYIGGTASYINFSTVLQQSQSTSSSALGSTAGFGQASGQDNIATYHCDDYGYVMGIMIIKPNTTYQQGVERFLSAENVFDDFVQPEFEGLSPQAILNKEIFVSASEAANDDLFCYQERNTSYKVRMNVNRGLFQCKPDKDRLFGAFTQARWFSSKPTFSYQFCVMSPDNMRRDWLAYPVYPAFRCQFLSDVFVVRSLSYSSQPNTFGF